MSPFFVKWIPFSQAVNRLRIVLFNDEIVCLRLTSFPVPSICCACTMYIGKCVYKLNIYVFHTMQRLKIVEFITKMGTINFCEFKWQRMEVFAAQKCVLSITRFIQIFFFFLPEDRSHQHVFISFAVIWKFIKWML